MRADLKALTAWARRQVVGSPLGQLSYLEAEVQDAATVEDVVKVLLRELDELTDVVRVGIGLVEGAGRRLRVAATEDLVGNQLTWRHVDAYDNVPLVTVLRRNEPVWGTLEEVAGDRPDYLNRQRRLGVRSLVAWPLPGVGSPVGTLVLFFGRQMEFSGPQRRLYEELANLVGDAIRQIRFRSGRGPGDTAPDDPSLLGGGERASLLLAYDPRAVSAGRSFLRAHLERWEVADDVIADALLCLSELLTNAVIHARTTSELTVHLDQDALTVVVRDLGGSSEAGLPVAAVLDDDELPVFGRGLTMVDSIADRWGSERDAAGTTAWFRLELEGPAVRTVG